MLVEDPVNSCNETCLVYGEIRALWTSRTAKKIKLGPLFPGEAKKSPSFM